MKAKLMALLLAVGLGLAGVVVTVQAAEGEEEVPPHVHEIMGTAETIVRKTDYNAMYHKVSTTTHYHCRSCEGFDITEEEFELHDYENVYDSKGNMIYSYCTGCDAYIRY